VSIIVTVDAGVGFVATAKQGPREHMANASAPELAVKIAAAGLVGRYPSDIVAEKQSKPGLWIARERAPRK
jgi:hypothetical protein